MSVGVEHLLCIEGTCTLHEVRSRGAQDVLARGPLNLYDAGSSVQARVGDISWRLLKTLPVLKYDSFTYTFGLAGRPGIFFCLELPPDTPREVCAMLDAILTAASTVCFAAGRTDLDLASLPADGVAAGVQPGTGLVAAPWDVEDEQARAPTTTDRVADGIVTGGRLLGRGLVAAAALAGKGLAYGAGMAVKNMPAGAAVTVSPSTRQRLDRAQQVTASAAVLTGRVAAGARGAAVRAASWAAGRISETSWGRSFSGGNSDSKQALMQLGHASLQAVGEVYDSMEQATLIVLSSGTAAAGQVIDHRYGEAAGLASRSGMHAATHCVQAAMNVRQLHPTALIRKTARHTAQDVILGARPAATHTHGTALGTVVITELPSDAVPAGGTSAGPIMAATVVAPPPAALRSAPAGGARAGQPVGQPVAVGNYSIASAMAYACNTPGPAAAAQENPRREADGRYAALGALPAPNYYPAVPQL